ncbi:MAG: AGE family epimerase/isomerase [Bacteroidales bacterium]|nr:AGE family epimerase/isomerase [Bacteroidales bacterium]
MDSRIKDLKAETTQECFNILSFWSNNTIDEQNGGFVGSIDLDMTKHPEHGKGAVLNARILWAYSAAYRIYKNPEHLTMARRAYDYVTKHFIDKEYGGVYWMLNADGTPQNTRKQIYAIAFAMYGLAEYYRISKKQEALDYAIGLFDVIEKYSLDTVNNGYYEAYSREWVLLEDLRLSEKDKNDPKTMNTHLHILEAYTNLYRVWREQRLHDALKNLIEVTIYKIINIEKGYFDLFFGADWSHHSLNNSYGHDIEGSWLLWEAAEVLGDDEIKELCRPICIKMAEQSLRDGVDADGGIMSEGTNGVVEDSDKHWWPQAEAIVGFMNAYQLTGNEKFLDASVNSWEFVKKYIIDHDNGEWYWRVTKDDHKVYTIEQKTGPWKCPYHNSRCCMEIAERFMQD